MALPTKFGFGAPLGTGEQFLSWIHIDDLCRLFIHALFTPTIQGVFNAVADNPINNRTFNQVLARVLNRPLWLPNVPSLSSKLFLEKWLLLYLVAIMCRTRNSKMKHHSNFNSMIWKQPYVIFSKIAVKRV
jgi:NAD dependent epimerase/dehydratase family enzyme